MAAAGPRCPHNGVGAALPEGVDQPPYRQIGPIPYGKLDDVIRNVDLEEIVKRDGKITRPSDGKEAKELVEAARQLHSAAESEAAQVRAEAQAVRERAEADARRLAEDAQARHFAAIDSESRRTCGKCRLPWTQWA